MATVIRDRRITEDNWRLLRPEAGRALPEIPAEADVIVPLSLWRERRADLLARSGRLGVWLDGHEGPETIAADLDRFALIAVNFRKFGDGRGFSTARLLRERYGWAGELRAIGEVIRDHLLSMERCGFDSFALREDQDPIDALGAFAEFSDAYQTSVTQPLPYFRRRLLEGHG